MAALTGLDQDLLPDGVRSRFMSGNNGLSMHVLEAGYEEPGRELLVLLHGFPELAYSWRKVMVPLAEAGYHVVAPDQRGYGLTTGWDGDYHSDIAPFRLFNLVRDVMGLVHGLGHESVAKTGMHMFMVSDVSDGFGVYDFLNGAPEQIAPHWLRRRIEIAKTNDVDLGVNTDPVTLPNIEARIYGTAFTIEGHAIYELSIPAARIEGGDSLANPVSTVVLPPLRLWYDTLTKDWIDMTPDNLQKSDALVHRFSATATGGNLTGLTLISDRYSTDVGYFNRRDPLVFGAALTRQWCYFEAGGRVAEQLDIEVPVRFTQYNNAAGQAAEQYWTAPTKADVNLAGGIQYQYSDNLGETFEVARQLTVNRHPRMGYKCIARGGKEKRELGRIHRFSMSNTYNVKIGPAIIDQQMWA